jgi:hypothetical protein
MFLIFPLVGIAPLLFFIWDGHQEKDIKRGLYQILAFFCTMGFAYFMLHCFSFYFALAVPVLFIPFIALIKIKKSNSSKQN